MSITNILLLPVTLLACLPLYAQTPTAPPLPDPIKVSPEGKPVEQPDPAAMARALTAAPKTPQPAPMEWWGWEKKFAGVKAETDVVIGTGGDQPLHIDITWPENPPPGLMPAILWIHGGAWQGESHHPNKAAYFASRGYFTASVEYRLAPKAKWPAQIEDCKLAVRWLRANAAKYHVDPNRIGCWGASAGGHLVSCMGTLDDPVLEGAGGFPGVSSKVQAVCDWFGPVDFRRGGPGVLFTESFAQNPALHLSASPYVHIKKTQPPFLIIHGDKDYTVPYKASVDFVDAILKAGAPVEFITVRGGMHGFGPVKGGANPDMSYGQIFARMAEFFDKYLKSGTSEK